MRRKAHDKEGLVIRAGTDAPLSEQLKRVNQDLVLSGVKAIDIHELSATCRRMIYQWADENAGQSSYTYCLGSDTL